MNEKKEVGEKAAEYVKDGMIVGLGTGSTVFYTIVRLGELIKQGLSIRGIPTSVQTEKLAQESGIPLVSFHEVDHIDVAIDGADEVNPELALIKGGGGALLREKIIANAADTFIVVADSHKIVPKLGAFPLPVEVVPFGFEVTMKYVQGLGTKPQLRLADGKPYITDNGNYILDCTFPEIMEPEKLERELNMIPGVVENGLFNKMADILITMDHEQKLSITNRKDGKL